jgi:hypothetical protein
MDSVFEIHSGRSAIDTTIVCNGHDITRMVRKIVFTADSSVLTSLELTAAHGSSVGDIEAAVADVKVVI